MNFILISSSVIFCIVFSIAMHRSKKKEEEAENLFWARERQANFTRKKPLDNLPYVTIPDELLNMEPACMTEKTRTRLQELNDLSTYTIVNLTGYTNTDLKLEYGTANITILSDYDFHYTKLATTLQALAECLHESGEDALALKTLEFAVSTGTDVSKSYYLLAELYRDAGTPEKIGSLIQKAGEIRALTKDAIVRKLQSEYQ